MTEIPYPYKLMHALGLQHAFDKEDEATSEFIHLFHKDFTDNYMDYPDSNHKRTYFYKKQIALMREECEKFYN